MQHVRNSLRLALVLTMVGCAPIEEGELDDVGAAEEELRGGRRCDSGYAEHGVYDATLVYGVDETVTGSPFLPMDADRDTLEYRTGAYDFFRERYGIDFDPSISGDQIATDGAGGQVLVQAIKTGEGSTHQVYALDVQHVPQWRGRFPITNAAFFDDGYFVFILSDFDAHGSYGGAAGLTLRAGDLVVQGEYRMFDDRGRLLDTITYFADTPATVNPFAGDVAASAGATFVNITCRVESPIMGTGVTRGIGEQRPLPGGQLDLDFRYVMRFPSRLSETTTRGRGCDRLRPTRW